MSTLTARRSPTNRYPRLIAAQWYLLLFAALAIAVECVYLVTVPPATGYETSVITAYPLPFWFAFGTALASTVGVLLAAGLTGAKYWKHAFALLVANYVVFFSLPLVRGYRLYGRGTSDTLYHLAYARDLLAQGTLTGNVFYPQIHVLLSELSLIGTPLIVARTVVPFAFTLAFISGIGVLLRTFIGDQRGLALGLAVGTPLVFAEFHNHINPATLSFMLFPIALLSIERIRRTNSKRHVLVVATLALALVFYHPVTTLLLIVLILSTVAFGPIYARFGRRNTPQLRPVLALATLCTAFVWYIDRDRTRSAVSDIVGDGGATTIATQTDKANEAALTTVQIVMRFVQLYGTTAIYLTIAGSFSLFVLRRFVRGDSRYITAYGVYQFGIGFVIAAAFLGSYLVASGVIRVTRYMMLAAILLVGLVLFENAGVRNQREQVIVAVVGCAVVVAAILGAFSTYQPNKQMTASEYEGAEFMAEYQAPSVPVRSLDLTRKTYWYVTSGGPDTEWTAPAYRQDEPGYDLADRLGYSNNETAARTFDHSYLVTQEYDFKYYTADYFTPAQQRERFVYGESDVEQMALDSTVEKIYANGEFRGWYVPSES